MKKDEFITRSLAKLTHKRWELFVVSRIIHSILDEEIEFVCQQHVRLPQGDRALTDIYFPQFDLHLEVDEASHDKSESRKRDALREQDIIDATSHTIERIKISSNDSRDSGESILIDVARKTDKIIEKLLLKKFEMISANEFEPWDFERKFDPWFYIERGFIDVKDNVRFRRQVDALRCFGFSKRVYRRGSWPINASGETHVWFPRLVEHRDWSNNLSDDGMVITERRTSGGLIHDSHTDRYPVPWCTNRITFAKVKDDLGSVMYRFIGVFSLDEEQSTSRLGVFRRTHTRVNTTNPDVGVAEGYDPNEKFGGVYDGSASKILSKKIRNGTYKVKK